MSAIAPTLADTERFQATFFEECTELLQDLEERLPSLQAGNIDSEGLNAVFRVVHSIKAGAAAFNFTSLVKFAHVFEALLDRMRSDRIQRTPLVFSVVVRGADLLAELVDGARGSRDVPAGYGDGVITEINELLGTPDTAAHTAPAKAPREDAERTHSYRIVFEPHPELFRHANEPLLLIRELKHLGELKVECDTSKLPDLSHLDPESAYLSFIFYLTTKAPKSTVAEVFEFVDEECVLQIEEDEAKHEAAAGEEKAAATPEHAHPDIHGPAGVIAAKGTTSIRVDLARVDRLVNMVGELVITQAMLAQQLSEGGGSQRHQWTKGSEDLAAQTRQLQECVMAIRMQPVRSVFARMPRLVRDISGRLNKKVRLVTSGDQTEVDKTVIEELADPITHMIRNAIDHGIEDAAVRRAAGKPDEATIELSASQRASNILITIADDGAGIDRPKVLKAAIAKGIVREDQKLSDDEIHNLLFAPGFSTAEKVTEISGRGVGMDVVRRNISNIGGRIQIQSAPGKGTRFTLVIPLTLAVLDGMLVGAGEEKFILPLSSIVESIRPDRNQIRTLSGGTQVASIRGEYIRLISLHRVLDIPGKVPAPWKALVVVIESESGSKTGLVVDELIGQQQVVVKSLLDNFDAVRGISGATILGDGRVALILDLDGLCLLPQRPLAEEIACEPLPDTAQHADEDPEPSTQANYPNRVPAPPAHEVHVSA
jgi:two-component system, chemotaxis family, sensor kinase CheA